ncbi:MAG: isoaspartyl peptidase/L-asparaginase [Bacteroidales bacterium]|nr:isoaspartyl peptidase/L-asparaginase [Bacteroidales bacterium]
MKTRYNNRNLNELISDCKKGDNRAQMELYKRYYKTMFNISFRVLNKIDEAEDVMQESFLTAFQKLDTYRGEVTFGAWLKKIVINKSLDILKTRKSLISLDASYEIADDDGGEGYATPEKLGEKGINAYQSAMDSALQIGINILESGGSGADAVEQVIWYLEDNPLFNAGRGAALTSEGIAELDASIMRGSDLNAGAVTGLTDVKHPISAARRVMDSSVHVMFSGSGATKFAKEQGLEIVPQDYFITEKSKRSLEKAIHNDRFGTVGCVALDKHGDLFAGTSTGGITNKKHGRVGDVPVIGAGTYAKNGVAGVSCTGQGEYYIRISAAKEIISLIQYKNYTVEQAARDVIYDQIDAMGAKGGIICLDKDGNAAMEFNTSAMFRAYANSTGERIVKIFPDKTGSIPISP